MPLFETKHTSELKAWLINELEPLCDADPEVLSDYVMALLKHDGSEKDVEKMLLEQLEDFLAEKTEIFVKNTLASLRAYTYLPVSERPSSGKEGESSKKRPAEDDGRGSPPKSSRVPSSLASSPPANAPRGPSSGPWGEGMSGSNRGSRERDIQERNADGAHDHNQNRVRRPREPCRDYHQKGFCPRGNECRWDHSPQAGAQLMNGFHMPHGVMGGMGQVIPGFPMGATGQLNIGRGQQGQQQPFMGGPPFGMQGGMPPHLMGVPPQAWNGPGASPDGMANGLTGGLDGSSLAARLGSQQTENGTPESDVQGAQTVPPGEASSFRGGRGGGRGGRGGGGRGTFGNQARSATTLVIENIPPESLDLVKINDYFKKFGTITNIQIDAPSQKALVSYNQPSEAKAAHSNPEVIFDNRFVKVYFQKLDEGLSGPQSQQKPQVVAPPPKSNFIPGQTSNVYHARPQANVSPAPSEAAKKAREGQQAAQSKLDGLIMEQKEVMTKLTGANLSPEDKKTHMARFKELEGELNAAKEELQSSINAVNNHGAGATESPAPPAGVDASVWREQREQREQKERERLDRELEAHSKGGGTTEELKATLARLQAEATSLGIDAGAAASPTRGSFRGAVRGGRGAFRGSSRGSYYAYRGRGSAMSGRPSMSLDNRTTKLRVSDVPSGDGEKREKAKEWFKQFGEVESVNEYDAGGILVNYKLRASGETALRSGLDIPDVGPVKATWHSDGTSTSAAASAPSTKDKEEGGEAEAEGQEGGEGEGNEEAEADGEREDHFRR